MTVPEQEINRLLGSVALKIRQSLDLAEVLQTSVEEVRSLLDCDRVIIYRFDPDWSGIVTVESVKKPNWSILGSIIKDSCFEESWLKPYQEGRVTSIEDLRLAEVNPCHREFLQGFNIQANLVVPILQQSASHLWGLLIAHECHQPRQWQNTEITLLKQLATQIGIAIGQAELLLQTKSELQQRQLIEQKIQQTRQFLQTVIDRLPVAVFVKDAGQLHFGKFLLWNKASERMFGLSAKQALGKTVYDYFPLAEADNLTQQDRQAATQQTVINIPEQTVNTSCSGRKIIHTTKVPIYNPTGEPEYLLCIAEDITRRKETELQLQAKSQELAEFSSNLKQLHRLNTTNYNNFDQLFRDYLQTGCQIFDCPTGIVSRIEQETYTIYAVESGLSSLTPQQQFQLGDTYCTEVIRTRQTVTYDHVGQIERLRTHPVYQNLQLETYIGTPIWVNEEIYGTLNFSSTEIRDRPFTTHEREIIEMMAQSIGKFLTAHQIEIQRQQAEAELKQAKEELEARVAQRTQQLQQINERLQQELYQRRQTQAALEESEARFRSMVNSFPMLVWVSGIDGNCTFLNQSWLDFTGRKLEKELDYGWVTGVHPEERQSCIETYQAAFNRRESFQSEYRLKRADGVYRWMLNYGAPRFRPDGTFVGYIGACLDISDRKQMEATLRESEKRWRTLLENIRLLVIGIDSHGCIDYANPFFLELTGYSINEITNRQLTDLLHVQHRQEAQRLFQTIIQPNSPYYYHHQNIILTKSGEEKIISWNSTQLCNLQGTPIGMMSIGEDITERRSMERMKDEFISVVSHELRTPLTSIHGALGLLVSSIVKPESQQGQRIITIAAESTERLVRLVNDILELERLESGKIDLIKKVVNAQDVMLRAVDQVQIMANRAGISLEIADQQLEFWADRDRIIQVLTNLLSNSIKFSERGSKVWLRVILQSPNVLFTVKDRGRGIPSDKLETIFERFHQVDASDSRRKGGTGLGLAICRNIIEQHGGKIWAESVYGKGSNFYFTIPLREVDSRNG